MAYSSILGGERAPVQPSGKSADLLGPSDSSDSGSDSIGEFGDDQLDSDSDRSGTGERASAELQGSGRGSDILPDRIERLNAGGGLSPDGDGVEDLAGLDDDAGDDDDELSG